MCTKRFISKHWMCNRDRARGESKLDTRHDYVSSRVWKCVYFDLSLFWYTLFTPIFCFLQIVLETLYRFLPLAVSSINPKRQAGTLDGFWHSRGKKFVFLSYKLYFSADGVGGGEKHEKGRYKYLVRLAGRESIESSASFTSALFFVILRFSSLSPNSYAIYSMKEFLLLPLKITGNRTMVFCSIFN